MKHIPGTIYSRTKTYSRLYYQKKKSLGMCVSCGNPSEPGLARCAYHNAALKQQNKQRYAALKTEVYSHYGSECACCGESEPAFLSIDHVGGGGNEHRRKIGHSASDLLRHLKKAGFPQGFQIMCHNCNLGQSVNGGTCPHKSKES